MSKKGSRSLLLSEIVLFDDLLQASYLAPPFGKNVKRPKKDHFSNFRLKIMIL
ncbi:hypothetical protein RM545_04245 [Zunongwangia sp. F260]|uniref:Uncharacterized protein n=1 Tax=Autumnicola lenta TaxID=3075593 RepID=A0ABU3CHS1_9FLAO|nr:hypothetical protein [Zunongwangia sp. F260]MDT0645889.1 hypothetical protein [Zunongwangia sp. F260]